MATRIPLRVLILEDSEFDAKVIVQALRTGGYDVQWRRVESASGMGEALASQTWDAVLADYNIPDFNAPQALRILQGAGHDIPFIIVSGGIGEDVAVAAMKAGAHDYVMKGNPARLLPAVERELRESEVRRRQRAAEERLRESELRYRTLWENSPDAVLICDAAAVVGFANPAAESVFGWAVGELAGTALAVLEPAGGGGLSQALNSWAQADPNASSRRALVEGRARRKDGREILVEVASSRMELPGGAWFVLFVRDITEKRENEVELRAREEQMRAAREIQQRLFPRQAPAFPGFDIAGTSVPADETGGDYYDFVPMVGEELGLVVADVSGHGLGPSLLMVETRALLRVVARNRMDPGEILARANRVIAEDVQGRLYVTLTLVRLSPVTGEYVFANAGHPAGLVFGPDGTVKTQLKRTGGPLGFTKAKPPASSPPARLEPGDILLLYTDGLRESPCPASCPGGSQEFGLERIEDVVRRNRDRSAGEIIQALCESVTTHCAPAPLEDDLTVVVVKALAGGAAAGSAAG